MTVSYFRNAGNVDKRAVRISQTFNEYRFGIGLDGLFHVCRFFRVYKSGVYPTAGESMCQQVVSSSINGTGRYNMVTGARDIFKCITDGGRSGGYGQGSYSSFQCSYSLFQYTLGGIGQSAIDVAAVF